jgi:ribosome assembly protein YihI (activator of Der GTPase)
MSNRQQSFLFYTSWKEQIDQLDDQELRRFINNLINFHTEGEIELPSRIESILWNGVLPALKKNKSSWENRSKSASENGKMGGAPKGNQNAKKENNPKQPKTTENNPKQGVKSKVLSVNSKVLSVNSKMSNVNCEMSNENCEMSNVELDNRLMLIYEQSDVVKKLENEDIPIEKRIDNSKKLLQQLEVLDKTQERYWYLLAGKETAEKLLNQ